MIVVNRNVRDSMRVEISGVQGEEAWAEALSGPSVDAMNDKDPNTCVIRPLPVTMLNGNVEVELPPHSLTAVRVEMR